VERQTEGGSGTKVQDLKSQKWRARSLRKEFSKAPKEGLGVGEQLKVPRHSIYCTPPLMTLETVFLIQLCKPAM